MFPNSDPQLTNALLNSPDNFLYKLANLELRVLDLETAQSPQYEEITGGGLTIADLILSPAADVLEADPTSTNYTGAFMAGEGIEFDGVFYVIGNVVNGEIKTGFTDSGTLYAIDADISGTITATAGEIGGWSIGATTISALTGGVGISMDSSVPAIYVGDTGGVHVIIDGANESISSSNYVPGVSGSYWNTATGEMELNNLTANGTITATAGAIGGWLIDATRIYSLSSNIGISLDSSVPVIKVGNTGSNYIEIDGANEWIRSSTYVTGAAGFNIDATTGDAEFNNLRARGMIQTAVFQKETVSSIGGFFLVLDSDNLDADMSSNDSQSVTILGNTTFAVGDILRMKSATYDEWLEVTDDFFAPTYNVTRDKAGVYAPDSNPSWTKGQAVVNYGQAGAGGILLAGGATPQMIVFTHNGDPWNTLVNQVVMAEGQSSAGNGAILFNEDGQKFPDGGDGISYDDIAYKEHAIQGFRTYADASISKLETIVYQVQSETSSISNGDFETGDFTDWTETDPGNKLTIATTDRGYSMQFSGSNATNNYITQSLSSSAPNGIVIKLKAKSSTSNSGIYFGTSATFGNSLQIPVSNEWRNFTFIVAESTSDVRIRPYGSGFIDDIEVYELANFVGSPTYFPYTSVYSSPFSHSVESKILNHTIDNVTMISSTRYGATIAGVLLGVQTLAAASTLTPTNVYAISTIRLTASGATDIYGIATEYLFSQNKVMTLVNLSAYTLTLKHNSTATEYHRFSLPNSADVTIAPGAGAVLQYYDDGGGSSTPRWYLVSSYTTPSTTPTDATLSFSDITTNNVTSTKHGFAPKSPADATKFLNGAATPDYALVKDSDLSTSDITTNDASTSKHGFVVKATAPAANVLNVVGIANGETAYTNKSIFDSTNPAALGTAAPGTSLIAAHRDHVHATPITVEQSTFTPRIDGTGTAGTGTYTTQVGYYTRIGNTVFIDIELVWTAHTGSGNMTVEGLPVTSNANVSAVFAVQWSNITLGAAGNKVQGRIATSTTSITLSEVGGGAASALALDTAATLRISGFYFV